MTRKHSQVIYDSFIEVLGDCVVSYGLEAATLIQVAIASTHTKYHMPGRKHALTNVMTLSTRCT